MHGQGVKCWDSGRRWEGVGRRSAGKKDKSRHPVSSHPLPFTVKSHPQSFPMQFELLASLLAKARDLPPGQLTYVVSAILGDSNSPEALDGMQSHASKLRDKAEANLSAAEKAAPTGRPWARALEFACWD